MGVKAKILGDPGVVYNQESTCVLNEQPICFWSSQGWPVKGCSALISLP